MVEMVFWYVIPQKKTCMTAELRVLLKVRDTTFNSRDTAALTTARANLNKAITLAKRAHGQKTQNHFQDYRDTRRLWQGIKSVTDYKTDSYSCDHSSNFLNKLNNYFERFEKLN